MFFNDPTLYGVNFRDLPLQNSFPGYWPQFSGIRAAAPQYGYGNPMVNTPQVPFDPYFQFQQFGNFQQFPFANPPIPNMQSYGFPYQYGMPQQPWAFQGGMPQQPWAFQGGFPFHNFIPGNQPF